MDEFDELKNEQPNEPEPEQPVPIIETLNPEDRQKYLIEKTKLKSKILRYQELFPHILQNFNYRIQELDKMEVKDLEYLLEELSIAVNCRNSSGLTKILYFESLRVVEISSKYVGLKIDGLREALQQNQQIHDCLNEISLKYENSMYMSPEIRLCYLTATTVLSLHKMNSAKSVVTGLLNEKVSKKVEEDFKDL